MQPTSKPHSAAFFRLTEWSALWRACEAALRARRSRPSSARYAFNQAELLLELQQRLRSGCWRHGLYQHFTIHEPKRRLISAASFEDRIVHHALCGEIEARFERVFIDASFANRLGKGTHAAIAMAQRLAQRHPYVLRMDVRQHFPSIDHQLLRQALYRYVPEHDLRWLIDAILASAAVDGPQEGAMHRLFPGDDLLALCRPKGLPIGNLTSQFWSNVYLHSLDLCVTRQLRCPAYLRYVDDFAIFGSNKSQLWEVKAAVVQHLARLRLTVHEGSAQVTPTRDGMPWLGMVVYPGQMRLKARKVHHSSRKLEHLYSELCEGRISFAAFDAAVQGWVNHARHADTEGLREHVIGRWSLPLQAWLSFRQQRLLHF